MQKILLLLVVSFFVGKNCEAQNLVSNPSFEIFDSCPSFDSQLYLATNWTININTVDYYNSCDSIPLDYSVPSNILGFQEAATGNAYAGFVAYAHTNPEANEFAGGQLISPLIPGTKYYITFKISLADATPNLMCGVDKIGMLFTNINLGDTVLLPNSFLNNYAHIYSSSIITDTINWVIVQGQYIADSAYNYFMVGHFFDFAHTDFGCLDSNNINNRFSYYYIDDVCVSPDSLACDLNPEGIYNLKETKSNINLYPNPATEQLIITHSSSFFNGVRELPFDNGQLIIKEIEISDALGRVQSCEFKVQRPVTKIDIHSLPSGIYFIKVYFADGSMEVRRFVKE